MPKINATVSVYQNKQARAFLLGMPREMKRIAIKAMGKQAMYELRKETEPPYKKVTRHQVYGRTFFTDKQRRFFFWAKDHGLIQTPYHRSHRQKEGWDTVMHPESLQLVNKAPNLRWTIGSPQGRMAVAKGWKEGQILIEEAMPSMIDAAINDIESFYAQRPWK